MLYRNWARRAELDLVNATNAEVKTGGRARLPSLTPCAFAYKMALSLDGPESLKARQWSWARQKLEYLLSYSWVITPVGFRQFSKIDFSS